MTHGHMVGTPPTAYKARCGGPQLCRVCAQELAADRIQQQRSTLYWMGHDEFMEFVANASRAWTNKTAS